MSCLCNPSVALRFKVESALCYDSYPGAIADGMAFAFLVLGEWALAVRPRESGAATP